MANAAVVVILGKVKVMAEHDRFGIPQLKGDLFDILGRCRQCAYQ